MKVDLHMHTTCSDGLYTPEQLTQMAVEAGLSVMAISDHDTVAAYSGHTFAPGVRVVPAIEMSSDYDGEDVHVLGYYIHPGQKDLMDYCARFKQRRLDRALEIADKCVSLGYDIDRRQIEDMLAKGGTVGRPHIARMLVARGYFPDVKAVFDTILYRGGPAYVPYHRLTVDACIDLIHKAGGLAFLAHPGLLKRTLSQVLQFSFDGLEVYHPNNRGRCDEFLRIARDHHWLVSGGSDFHGVPGRFPETVGTYAIEGEWVQDILTYPQAQAGNV